MTRPSALLALIAVGSATCALAQTPPPAEDPTAPSAASSPHQRDSTATGGQEATPTSGAEPSSAATPHQREVTQGRMAKAVTPQSFVSQAAVIGKAEIELGQLAIQQTQNPRVREYAQRMVNDHQTADARLQQIAGDEKLELPQSLDAEHLALKAKLSELEGAAFDREYAKAMAKEHDRAVALFESASQAPHMTAQLKEFAAATLPMLKQHMEMAHALHSKEGA